MNLKLGFKIHSKNNPQKIGHLVKKNFLWTICNHKMVHKNFFMAFYDKYGTKKVDFFVFRRSMNLKLDFKIHSKNNPHKIGHLGKKIFYGQFVTIKWSIKIFLWRFMISTVPKKWIFFGF